MAGLGGGGGAAAGVRAGRAYVEMFLKADGVRRTMDRVKGDFDRFAGIAVRAGAAIGGLGAGITAGFKPAFDMLGDQAKIADLADLFGISGEKASRLFGIMAAGGSDLRDAQEGLATFGQRINDAVSGKGEEAIELFKELGVSAQEFAGLDTADRFYKLLDAIKSSTSPLGKLGLLMKAMGEDTGKSLGSVLQMSTEQMRELGDVFQTSSADLNTARDAARSQTIAMASLKKVWGEIATAIAPVVKEMAEQFTANLKPVMEFVRANREVVATVLKVGGAMALAGGALVILAPAIGAVAGAWGGMLALGGSAVATMVATVKLLAAGVTALLSPVGLVTAAVVGLGYLWVTQTESGAAAFAAVKGAALSLFEYLKGAFNTVVAVGTEAWGGIVAAVQKGDLQLAAEIGLTALELLWAKTVAEMNRLWVSFGSQALEAWHELTGGMGEYLAEAWAVVKEVFSGIWETVSGVVGWIKEAWNGLSDSMKAVVAAIGVAFAPIAGPIMAVVHLIEKAWDGATGNMRENLNTFATWAMKLFVDVKATIVNAFNAIARTVLDVAIKTAKALDSIHPGDKWGRIAGELEAMKGGLTDVDAAAEKAALDAARDAANAELRAEREKAKKAREEARAADAKAAEDRAAELEKKLKDLTAKAKEPAAGKPKGDYGGGADFGPVAAPGALEKLAGSRGSFTAAMASQRFGGQTVQQKQLGELKGIKDGVKGVEKAVKDVGKKLEFK